MATDSHYKHSSKGWQQVPAPNPGTGDKVLGGISAAGKTVWAVGYFKTDTGRSPMIELHLVHLVTQAHGPGR